MRSQAHPMLQPTDWSRTPEELRGALPEDRRRIFELLWNCALACTMPPPVLVHRRAVYQASAGAAWVAFATLVADPERAGYWTFRQDFPAQRFTTSGALPTAAALPVTAAVVRPGADGAPLGAVLGRMQAQHLATAASAARTLQELAEGTPTGLRITSGADDRAYALPTEDARRWLARWREAGMLGQAPANHAVIDALADGRASYRDVLAQLLPDPQQAARAAAGIDQMCARWKGLGQAESAAAQRQEAAGVPHHEGLPQWLDPELQLPAAHPWRALRARMEQALATTRNDWLSLEDAGRAQARLDWLASDPEARIDAALQQHLTGEFAAFDAVRYWLTGSKPPATR